MILENKRILLGVTGGIAAYKAAFLASRLTQAGALVDVIMTADAARFVTAVTFRGVTGRPVYDDLFGSLPDGRIVHVNLGHDADLLVIAPATAHTLARLAHGLADDLLTATALACTAPLLLAPAMEEHMWQHPATHANLATLLARGAQQIGPTSGHLASGATGLGRLAEPEEIMAAIRRILARQGPLAGRRVVITAGGTREPIDPVRYVGNRSSGKMGMALGEAALDLGAAVTVVHGPLSVPLPLGVESVPVETAVQMGDAVLARQPETDVLIGAAAVADFRPAEVAGQKIKKKGDAEGLVITLVRNPDILAEVARHKPALGRPCVTIGFAAETENLLDNAQAKLAAKGLDLIVANDVTASDAGFAVDTNRVVLLAPGAAPEPLPLLSKQAVAEGIMQRVVGLLVGQAESG